MLAASLDSVTGFENSLCNVRGGQICKACHVLHTAELEVVLNVVPSLTEVCEFAVGSSAVSTGTCMY